MLWLPPQAGCEEEEGWELALEELRVDGCSVTDEGGLRQLAQLVKQGRLPRLRALGLGCNAITGQGLSQLLLPPCGGLLPQLQRLHVGGNTTLGGGGGGGLVQWLLRGGGEGGLQELDVSGCHLTDHDLRPLVASSSSLPGSLRALHLHDNPALSDGALAGLLLPHLPQGLRSLKVANTQAGPMVTHALLARLEVGAWPGLVEVEGLGGQAGEEEGEEVRALLRQRRQEGSGKGEVRAEWVTWLADD